MVDANNIRNNNNNKHHHALWVLTKTVFCFLFYFGQQVADPYLLKARAAQCVDRTLTELNARQLTATDEWERWNAQQRSDATLNDIMAANMEVRSRSTLRISRSLM